MMKPWIAVVLALLAAPVRLAGAEGEGSAWLVSFAELEERLGGPDLRILDARPKADFAAGHIPGAVWVDAKAVEAMAARPGALTDQAAWEAWLAPLGIGPATRVVVLDANRQLDAARLWWLLGYLGVERVGLLDGGYPLWAAEKRPVTTAATTVEPRSFQVAFRAGRHATRAEALAALKARSATILDARSDGEYAGTAKGPKSKRSGHIPSACHLEWNDLVDPNGRFLDEPALRAKVARAGIVPGKPVITHCQGGGRASVAAFALARLGLDVRNYYLGWSDWGNADETPIETGPKPEN